MTIRSRLLSLLMPTLILFVALISLFFFYNWNDEISASFRSNVKSIVITTADLINPTDIQWINAHRHDAQLAKNPIYQKTETLLKDLQSKLPVTNLYVVAIEPVQIGERVILDQPQSEENKVYDGTNPEYAFRQVYLADSDHKKNPENKVYQEFSESNEHLIYNSKKAFVTPIYKAKGTNEFYLTGYAPILDATGQVIALVGADINMNLFDRIVHHAILVMVFSALVTIILVTLSVYFIANKISQPVNQLKNAALALAAGDYEENIAVTGPKEISELANTFNTMRECLLDHINRMRGHSLTREKLFGEQECALLLQHRMLEGVIDRFDDRRLLIKHITSSLSPLLQGLKLDLNKNDPLLTITLSESQEEGFEGVYALISQTGQLAGSISAKVHFDQNLIEFQNHNMPAPLVWSTQQSRFLPDQEPPYTFEEGDFFFLFNQELAQLFPHRQTIRDWIGKVMRQFAKENIDLLAAMLSSEINFSLKKQHTPRNIHLFCFQLSSNATPD